MKKYIYLILAATVLPLMMTSCLHDDDEKTEISENCYISSFSLGQLKRTMYVRTTDGKDSTYTTAYSGAVFNMIINQREQTIENLDSLPTGTRLDKVLVTVNFDGVLAWRKAEVKTEEDKEWNTFESKDSINLSEPLHFRVISASGLSERIYTVKVNVHQQNGDSTSWNNLGKVEALGGIKARKALAWNGKLMVLGLQEDGTLTCVQHPLSTNGDWQETAVSGATNAEPTTIQTTNDAMYMSTTDGNILTSSDGQTWTDTGITPQTGLRLVAASDTYLYALCDGKLLRSNGGEWEEEALDDDSANLPSSYLNSAFYIMQNGMQRVMLIGSRNDTDTKATIWAKTWDKDESKATWTYYTPNDADKYRCPIFENLCIVRYDNGLQALGGKSRDGKYEAMDSILHSADHGITWKTYENDDMLVDADLQKVAAKAKYITAVADDEQFLWIVLDDEIWRGRINRLGFERK